MAEPGTRDGLQAERTGLAWQRTALGAGAVSLLLFSHAARDGWGALTAPAVLTAIAAAVLVAGGAWRERDLRRAARPAPARTGVLGVVALLVVSAAVLVLVLLLS